jgi:hypothetical protein
LRPVFRHCVGGGSLATCLPPLCGRREPCDLSSATVWAEGALRPSPRSRSQHVSCVMASWRPSHLLLPLPGVAKNSSLGSTKPTTWHVVSEATCAQWRCLFPSEPLKSRLELSPPAFANRPFRGRRPGNPLRLHPHLSSAACPGHAGLCYASLRAVAAGRRWTLGPSHRRARGAAASGGGQPGGGVKKAFLCPIRQ